MKPNYFLLFPILFASLAACGKSASPSTLAATTTESVDTRARRLLDQLEAVPPEGIAAFLSGKNMEMRIVDSEAVSPSLRGELHSFLAQHHVDIVGNPTQ